MLYITFTIASPEKFTAFKKLYQHMCAIRTPDYQETAGAETIDWTTATEEEMDAFMDKDSPKIELFHRLFPEYAQQFLANYFYDDAGKSVLEQEDIVSFFNYLEYGFEVDLSVLEQFANNEGIVKFSTGNYPFGGLERFFMTLKAFEMHPLECFDGFEVFQFQWTAENEFEALILPEKTMEYLSGFHRKKGSD
jgi:hypothetical protein